MQLHRDDRAEFRQLGLQEVPRLEGQTIASRYTCGALQSQSSLGPLYAAQREDGHRLSVQVIAPRRPFAPEALQKAERELQSLSRLKHPYLARVAEVVADNERGLLFVVREQGEGETLRARLLRSGRPPVEAALDLVTRVAEALQAGHSQGLHHHRLRPEIVFLERTRGGDAVRVLDLGLSRLQAFDPRGASLERARYLAPEQVVNPRGADARADVYCLGLLLYELLAGRHPFNGADVDSLLLQHANDRAPKLTDRAPDRLFSAELEGLVSSMLAKAPLGRPADAGMVLARLRGLRQSGDLVIALDEREERGDAWRLAGPEQAAAAQRESPSAAESPVAPRPPSRPVPAVRSTGIVERVRPDAVGVEDARGERVLPPRTTSAVQRVPESGPPSPVPAPAAPNVDDAGLAGLPPPEDVPRALADMLLPENATPSVAPPPPAPRGLWNRRFRLGPVRLPVWALLGISLLLLGIVALLALSLAPAEPVTRPKDTPPARPVKPLTAATRKVTQPAVAPASASPPAAKVTPLPAKAPSPPASALPVTAPPPKAAPSTPTPAAPPAKESAAPPARVPAAPPVKAHNHELREPKVPREAAAVPKVVTVRILSRPAGAEVSRGGELIGTTPFSEAVPRGTESLIYQLSRAGYTPTKVSVLPDQDRRVEQELSPVMLLK